MILAILGQCEGIRKYCSYVNFKLLKKELAVEITMSGKMQVSRLAMAKNLKLVLYE